MRHSIVRALLAFTVVSACHGFLQAQSLDIPVLNWTPRSDWVNVKTAVTPAAIGDGIADDTAALQAALNLFTGTAGGPKVLYLPPGTYRITNTLTWPSSVGCSIIGHGRDTKILWNGAPSKDMLRTDGAAQASFIGIVWDGGNRANGITGVHHNAKSRFESANRHQHEAFINLNKGIAGDYSNGGTLATSEMVIDNCLFVECNTGIQFSDSFNYYNETITRSEFRNCGVGVRWGAGYGYVRFCHFQNSSIADIQGAPRCSVRFCTSVGSTMFYTGSTSIGAILQNNVVSGYTGSAAVTAGQGSLIFDNVFLNPPSQVGPVQFVGPAGTTAQAIVSNNSSPGTTAVYSGLAGYREVPAGSVAPLALLATDRFLQTEVPMPTQIFDAKVDFGAIGNGSVDDTVAVQNTINAAKAAGNGALAYFPTGQYRVTSSIVVDGSNYSIAGTGYYSEFKWTGAANGVVFQVVDPKNVRMENISMQDYLLPVGTTGIRQTSNGGTSSIVYDRLTLVQGPRAFSLPRTREGLHLVNLPSNATVHLGQILGTVRISDSGQAVILGEMMNTSGELIDGALLPKTGFTGFLTRNGVNLFINDNNDFIAGDSNMEQSSPWNQPDIRAVWASGGARSGPGQVTIGAMKINLFDSPNVTEVDNYEGLFSMLHASIADGGFAFAQTLHSGSRPVELLYGLNFSPRSNPLLETAGPGASYRNVRNFHQSSWPSEWYAQGAVWTSSPVAKNPAGPDHALRFDGVDDYVQGAAARYSAFSGDLTSLTVQAWVKLDALGRDTVLVAHSVPNMASTWSTNIFSLEVGANNRARFMVRNNVSPYTPYFTPWSSTVLSAGEWYLITGVWNGTSVDIYVNDGPSEGQTTTPAFGALRSGGNSHQSRILMGGLNARFLKGSLDEVRFYSLAKDQVAIDASFNGGDGVYGSANDPGLIAGYHFDEGADKNAFDYKSTYHAQLYQYNVDSTPPDTNESIRDAMDHYRELAWHAYDLNFPVGGPFVDFSSTDDHANNFVSSKVTNGTLSWNSGEFQRFTVSAQFGAARGIYDVTPGDPSTSDKIGSDRFPEADFRLSSVAQVEDSYGLFSRVNDAGSSGYLLMMNHGTLRIMEGAQPAGSGFGTFRASVSTAGILQPNIWYSLRFEAVNSGSNLILTGKLYAQNGTTPLATVTYTDPTPTGSGLADGQCGYLLRSRFVPNAVDLDNFAILDAP